LLAEVDVWKNKYLYSTSQIATLSANSVWYNGIQHSVTVIVIPQVSRSMATRKTSFRSSFYSIVCVV